MGSSKQKKSKRHPRLGFEYTVYVEVKNISLPEGQQILGSAVGDLNDLNFTIDFLKSMKKKVEEIENARGK